ncbi:MAG: STAS domain-containing protein [Nitrospinota bacterium]
MEYKIRDLEGVRIIDLLGNIRSQHDYKNFNNAMNDVLSETNKNFAINFSGVQFISSTGLGRLSILSRQVRERSGQLIVYNLNHNLSNTFALANLDQKITVCETEGEMLLNLKS